MLTLFRHQSHPHACKHVMRGPASAHLPCVLPEHQDEVTDGPEARVTDAGDVVLRWCTTEVGTTHCVEAAGVGYTTKGVITPEIGQQR